MSESVRKPIGDEFESLYKPLFEQNIKKIEKLMNQEDWMPETKRMRIFLECATPNAWDFYGIGNILQRLNKPNSLLEIPSDLLTYLINTTAHFSTIMSLRDEAKKRVFERGLVNDYHEYSKKRIYGGVTRSDKRWSFLPHPVKYQGQTRNPMHGLALYSQESEFLGYVPFNDAQKLGKIVYLNNKPLFVKLE